jgi:hypothetical protein
VLNSTAVSNIITFEISELVDDYVTNEFNGDYATEPLWVEYTIQNTINGSEQAVSGFIINQAVSGYSLFEEGANKLIEQSLLINNNVIVKYDDDALNIPINVNKTNSVSMLYRSEEVATENYTNTDESDLSIKYLSNAGVDANSYKDYVIKLGDDFEDSQCLRDFEREYPIFPIDKIIIDGDDGVRVVKVRDNGECLYEVKKLTFINKNGVLQDIWCFQSSVKKLALKEEKYNANIVSNGSFKTCNHQSKILTKTGQRSVTLNTGFVPGSYNAVIEELMLSRQVWLTEDNVVRPVNVADSSFTFKNKIDDRLINYKFNINYATQAVNNVR